MRTRTFKTGVAPRFARQRLVAGAAFLVIGAGAASNAMAQQQLRGSDTLEEVTKSAITAAGIGGQIAYIGGGTSAGENAMKGATPTQRVAPMSRQLNAGVAGDECIAGAQQLLLALDGLAVVGANQTDNDSLTGGCSDSVSGGKTLTGIMKADGVTPCDAGTDGCATAGEYTFANWKEVLAMVYGGQNHNAPAALNVAAGATCTYTIVAPADETGGDAACAAGEVCYPNNRCGNPALVGRRNPNKVNCLSPVRQRLVDNWGFLFSDSGTPSCRTAACTKLRHAFRRDDLSGTTDVFVALVGLPALANPTKAFITNVAPKADRQATASPFCNSGERPMNKSDGDYLDLDPIRRSVDLVVAAGNRNGLEQVGSLVPGFGGNNNDALCMPDLDFATPGIQPPIPQDHGSSTQPGIWPDPNLGGTSLSRKQLLWADIGYNPSIGAGSNGDSTGLMVPPTNPPPAPPNLPYGPTTKLCLGLVTAIAVPGNFNTPQVAYYGDAAGNPVICDVTDPSTGLPALADVIMDTLHSADAICPNGTNQPCSLPYKFDAAAPGGKNFNCLVDRLNPQAPGVQDMRVYNLYPRNTTGQYVRDNYLNSNFSLGPSASANALRQSRVVSAFYRMHVTQVTNRNGSVPTLPAGSFCRLGSATDQIGCLVKANACSIGYAGREAIDAAGTPANMAFRIEGFPATIGNVENLVLTASTADDYPLARTLWLNSIVGFGSPLLSAGELALFNAMNTPATIDPIITQHKFIQVPASVTRLKVCPATFP